MSESRFAVLVLAFLVSQATLHWFWRGSMPDNAPCGRGEGLAVPVGGTLKRSFEADRHNGTGGSRIGTGIDIMADSDLGGVIPRAFDKWPSDVPLPCLRPDDNWWHPSVTRFPSRDGILYVKEMKCGSSTLAGVTLRIARSIAKARVEADRWFEGARPLCKTRFDHTAAWKLDYGNRIKDKSFLWTVIREPARRLTSEFFHFEVSRAKEEPSDANFLRYIQSHRHTSNYYLRDLLLNPAANSGEAETGWTPRILQGKEWQVVNSIINGYDFIGITERMHESLVALQMILGLETTDILYLKAKGSGSWDDGAANNGTCVYIVPSFVSPGMKNYFASDRWKNRMKGDYLLYRATHKSLDLTIERLGRDKFEENLARFEKAMSVASEKCKNVVWPCSNEGKKNGRTDCMWLDSACGVQCLDTLTNL